jgi:hypothetical protein
MRFDFKNQKTKHKNKINKKVGVAPFHSLVINGIDKKLTSNTIEIIILFCSSVVLYKLGEKISF